MYQVRKPDRHEKTITKNATEVDGGVVGWGHWCDAAVPTMIETVAAAWRRRNVL